MVEQQVSLTKHRNSYPQRKNKEQQTNEVNKLKV